MIAATSAREWNGQSSSPRESFELTHDVPLGWGGESHDAKKDLRGGRRGDSGTHHHSWHGRCSERGKHHYNYSRKSQLGRVLGPDGQHADSGQWLLRPAKGHLR